MSAPRLEDLGEADPYELLGIPTTADADQIRAAFRDKIRTTHPDLPTGSEQAAKLLQIARDILLDPQRRTEYDNASAGDHSAWGHADDEDDDAGAASSIWDSEDVADGMADSPFSEAHRTTSPAGAPAPPMGWADHAYPGAEAPQVIGMPPWGPHHHQAGWGLAHRLFQYLSEGNAPRPFPTPLTLDPGEWLYADAPLEYARFYGTTVHYTRRSTIAFGSIPFMIGAYTATAISNAAERSRARAMASPQWREAHTTRVVLTSRRVIANVQGRWLSFHHGDIAEFAPSPIRYALVLAYDGYEPLSLRGPLVPWVSVTLASLLYTPQPLSELPAFAPFLPTVPRPPTRPGPGGTASP